jgi:uncharacterized iron-regulated membrane protein
MSTTNQNIFKLHSWLGLFNGVWLLILGVSGSLLVYYHEIDRWLNKDVLTVVEKEHRLSVDSLCKIVRARQPDANGTNIIHFPTSKTDCYSFRIYSSDGSKSITHWWETYNIDIDPYSGKILREGYYRDIRKSFMHWLLNFHWSLNAGPPGLLVIALAGLLLFLNIITGVIIYRKYFFKALAFRAPIQWKNWRTGTSGLHRYIGVWSLLFNVLIFYSGLQMNWNAFDKETWIPPKVMEHNNEKYASIDKMIADVQNIYPGFEAKYFYIPFTKTIVGGINTENARAMGNIPGTASIIPESSSSVAFNINTGAVIEKKNINEEIKKMSWWGKFNAIVYSFHVGSFAGSFSRILYVFIGLTPALLSISGFMLWWRRKKKISKRASRF